MATLRRTICALLALLVLTASFTACGSKDPDPVNTRTGSFDDMVTYLTEKGYIVKDTQPVDMLTTEGYITDNTDSEFPCAPFADRAEDYGGLWLMWWDAETPSDTYTSCFANIAMNGGIVVYMGGAAVMETAAYSGSFAIAFAEDYAKADEVIADFNNLPRE